MSAYEEILKLCSELEIFTVGVTTAQPFLSVAESLSGQPHIGAFCEKDIRKRVYPTLTMEAAKSIICLLFPYKKREKYTNGKTSSNAVKGKIASGDVWLGVDYHIYVSDKLEQLCELLKHKLGCEYMYFCDIGPLVDKEVAVRAGLCKYGRNSLAINKKHGSFFYIAYILTDLEISNAVTHNTRELCDLCDECDRCIKACPTGALSHNMPLEHAKCISYISQKKGDLTAGESLALGNALYGCHVCQYICPANSADNEEFVAYVDMDFDLNISNKAFSNKFCSTAMRFLGKKRFVRNALAVLDNANNSKNRG